MFCGFWGRTCLDSPSLDIEWAGWWEDTKGRASKKIDRHALYDHFGLDRHYQFWFPRYTADCPAKQHGAPLVRDAADYLEFKKYLMPKSAVEDMRARIEEALPRYEDGSALIWYTLEGFFWFPREILGIEPHLYSFYDEPELYHRICEDLLEWQLGLVEEFSKYMKADFMTIAEDMSYNQGPMLSEELFEEFLAPYYRRLFRKSRSMAQGLSWTPTAMFPSWFRG